MGVLAHRQHGPCLQISVDGACDSSKERNSWCSNTCPTRISELKSAMATFPHQSSSGWTHRRLGMTVFPTDTLCAALGRSGRRPLPPLPTRTQQREALRTAAQSANNHIGLTLRTSGSLPRLSRAEAAGLRDGLRDDFVLLLTDGLPNCNEANPNNLCRAAAGALGDARISPAPAIRRSCLE